MKTIGKILVPTVTLPKINLVGKPDKQKSERTRFPSLNPPKDVAEQIETALEALEQGYGTFMADFVRAKLPEYVNERIARSKERHKKAQDYFQNRPEGTEPEGQK